MEKKNWLFLILGLSIPVIAASFFFDFELFFLLDYVRTAALDFFMSWLTYFGSTFVVLILMTSFFLWEERKREWIPPLLISFFSSIIIGFIIKLLIARPRPFSYTQNFFGIPDYSFPSLHAIAAFSSVAILDKEYPRLKWFWLLFALLVSFSRVYVKVHYFSDVLAGALIGYLVGYLVMSLEKKYKFFKVVKT